MEEIKLAQSVALWSLYGLFLFGNTHLLWAARYIGGEVFTGSLALFGVSCFAVLAFATIPWERVVLLFNKFVRETKPTNQIKGD